MDDHGGEGRKICSLGILTTFIFGALKSCHLADWMHTDYISGLGEPLLHSDRTKLRIYKQL